jgi:hypothetical protein
MFEYMLAEAVALFEETIGQTPAARTTMKLLRF